MQLAAGQLWFLGSSGTGGTETVFFLHIPISLSPHTCICCVFFRMGLRKCDLVRHGGLHHCCWSPSYTCENSTARMDKTELMLNTGGEVNQEKGPHYWSHALLEMCEKMGLKSRDGIPTHPFAWLQALYRSEALQIVTDGSIPTGWHVSLPPPW